MRFPVKTQFPLMEVRGNVVLLEEIHPYYSRSPDISHESLNQVFPGTQFEGD